MKISIVIIVGNESNYIKKCLEALLSQSYQEFEIVALDNGSTDGTGKIIKSFDDKRIKYIYEPSNCGIAELRNIGIRKSAGEYIFFTDGDCVPNKHWLEEGMSILETKTYVGVEGKTYYESQQKITISDCNIYQFGAGEFMTCNVAYSRNILEKVNYFDPAFKYGHEDRDLALRVMKFGEICFSPDMLVAHQRKRLTPKVLFKKSRHVEDMVYLIKKHGLDEHKKYGWQERRNKNILYPKKLLFILCPLLLILTERYTSINDLILGVFRYISYAYERILIWKSAVKNRVFII